MAIYHLSVKPVSRGGGRSATAASAYRAAERIEDHTTGIGKTFNDIMTTYGTNFRTFKHGVLHGTITGIVIALPIIAINAMFEMKKAKYILIHFGYWTLTLALVGGVMCAML